MGERLGEHRRDDSVPLATRVSRRGLGCGTDPIALRVALCLTMLAACSPTTRAAPASAANAASPAAASRAARPNADSSGAASPTLAPDCPTPHAHDPTAPAAAAETPEPDVCAGVGRPLLGVRCTLTPRQFRWQQQHSVARAEPYGVCIDARCIARSMCAEQCLVSAMPDLEASVAKRRDDCRQLPLAARRSCLEDIGTAGSATQLAASAKILSCMRQCGYPKTEPIP